MVDVYAKNLPAERVSTSFDEQLLKVQILDDSGAVEFELDVDLYGRIVASASRVEVLRSKVEITMTKADKHSNWATLQKSSKVAAPKYSAPTAPSATRQYPTSVKAPKDWSKVESELDELDKKGDLEDGDPLNSFFKKIFSQGDEDQRRAMMKSFVESNGTVLSTNWEEVGTKKVECTPPEGMEVHKWNE